MTPEQLVPAMDDVAAWLRWCETTGRWWGGTALADVVVSVKDQLLARMTDVTAPEDRRELDAYYEMVFGTDDDEESAG